jgi:hypothetical protein
MPPNVIHSGWFTDTGTELTTTTGQTVRIIDFNHVDDETMLNTWAKHFRNQYIQDEKIDEARTPMGLSRSDYLKDIKFPNTANPGASVRSGDFSEVLVADYIQFVLDYTVPRTRHDAKLNRNTSPNGVDVIGFKLVGGGEKRGDEMITFEVKASLAAKNKDAFQNAIDHSKKDFNTRTPEALNAMRQRLKERGDLEQVKLVERFQNKTDHPFKEVTGAVLVCSTHCWEDGFVTSANSEHPNDNLYLLAIRGEELMALTNKLYKLAYDSA